MADVLTFPRKGGEDDLEFRRGDVLVRGRDDGQFFVLEVEEGGNRAVLVPIEPRRFPGQVRKPTVTATLKEMAGWKPLYMSGERLVEAFDRRTHELMWEAYVPGIVEALCRADEIYSSESRQIDPLIHTGHYDEDELLIQTGYRGDESVPPDLKR